jgi:hypothetical protein
MLLPSASYQPAGCAENTVPPLSGTSQALVPLKSRSVIVAESQPGGIVIGSGGSAGLSPQLSNSLLHLASAVLAPKATIDAAITKATVNTKSMRFIRCAPPSLIELSHSSLFGVIFNCACA